MTETTTTITKTISGMIEKLTDNYIAIAVITTFLYMMVKRIDTPESLVMMVGFVIKYYFDKGEKNDNINTNKERGQ